MNSKNLSLCLLAIMLCGHLFSQEKVLPSANLYTLDGEQINANTISNEGKPMILLFWKSYNLDGNNQILMLDEVYDLMAKDREVKFVAICSDCLGTTDHIKPFVFGNDIAVEVYVDKNGDLSRAMCIPETPFTLLYDTNMEVYCKYIGYCANGEEMLCKKISECLDKMEE